MKIEYSIPEIHPNHWYELPTVDDPTIADGPLARLCAWDYYHRQPEWNLERLSFFLVVKKNDILIGEFVVSIEYEPVFSISKLKETK